jgi:hypothetical protein
MVTGTGMILFSKPRMFNINTAKSVELNRKECDGNKIA